MLQRMMVKLLYYLQNNKLIRKKLEFLCLMLNKKFIISGCLPIMVATIVTYFGYFINTYHLDTSIQIASNGMNSMYMSQGRYVVVLLNKILYGNYSLYDNQIIPFITIFILILCGSYLYFLLSNYSDISSYIVKLCISIFFVNNPIIYSQLFFKLQAVCQGPSKNVGFGSLKM